MGISSCLPASAQEAVEVEDAGIDTDAVTAADAGNAKPAETVAADKLNKDLEALKNELSEEGDAG